MSIFLAQPVNTKTTKQKGNKTGGLVTS